MDIVQPTDEKAHLSIEAGLEMIASINKELFIYYLLGYGADMQKIRKWNSGQYDDEFKQLKPIIRELIKKPAVARRRILDFSYEYLTFFQREQKKIEPWLIRSVHNSQQQLEKDPITFLNSIHPRFFAKDNYFEFHKAKTYQFFYKDLKKIYILPSTFVDPHLLLGIQPESISVGLHVEVPSNFTKANVPLDFVRTMKTLSDPTRIAILKNLLKHPFCIQQLADIHQISEPAVKKHLKLLAEADLIWSERKGYYVFYKAIPEKLEMLTVDIHQFIDMKNHLQKE